jgi:hypothetical protein
MTKYRPNTEQAARDTLEDLGLIDDDRTEDLCAFPTRAVSEAWIDQQEHRRLRGGSAADHDRKKNTAPRKKSSGRRHHRNIRLIARIAPAARSLPTGS